MFLVYYRNCKDNNLRLSFNFFFIYFQYQRQRVAKLAGIWYVQIPSEQFSPPIQSINTP